MSRSPDAVAILALPAAAHPQLSRFVAALAMNSTVSLAEAETLIADVAKGQRITTLDIEMVQPDARYAVTFVPTVTTPQDEFQASVSRHLTTITEARR